MKRIVLLTDPDRMDPTLVERLQWLFPECELDIVAVACERRPASLARQDTTDKVSR
jgi:hypothetical protein